MAKKKEQKVYMPLMIGDWLKGTRGMRAEVKGVYIGLLLHQWDHGFIPSDIYELELIEPEINKVWVILKRKFVEVAPGKLQNQKCEEVREFWKKQKKNGGKGGRPKKDKPIVIPNNNPKANPNHNHHNDLDLDNEFKYQFKESVDFTKPDIDGDDLVFPIDTGPVRDLWAGWKKCRWENHQARYGIMGEQADLKRMEGMTFDEIKETLLAAIGGKWQNIYPKKQNGKSNHKAVNSRREGFAKRASSDTGS